MGSTEGVKGSGDGCCCMLAVVAETAEPGTAFRAGDLHRLPRLLKDPLAQPPSLERQKEVGPPRCPSLLSRRPCQV